MPHLLFGVSVCVSLWTSLKKGEGPVCRDKVIILHFNKNLINREGNGLEVSDSDIGDMNTCFHTVNVINLIWFGIVGCVSLLCYVLVFPFCILSISFALFLLEQPDIKFPLQRIKFDLFIYLKPCPVLAHFPGGGPPSDLHVDHGSVAGVQPPREPQRPDVVGLSALPGSGQPGPQLELPATQSYPFYLSPTARYLTCWPGWLVNVWHSLLTRDWMKQRSVHAPARHFALSTEVFCFDLNRHFYWFEWNLALWHGCTEFSTRIQQGNKIKYKTRWSADVTLIIKPFFVEVDLQTPPSSTIIKSFLLTISGDQWLETLSPIYRPCV